VTGTGHWHRLGQALVAVRWVHVHDSTATHRDEYLFTTDLHMTPNQIVDYYTRRWSIESTFQGCREYLKLEFPKRYGQQTVLRFYGLFICIVSHCCPALPTAISSLVYLMDGAMKWKICRHLLKCNNVSSSVNVETIAFSNAEETYAGLKTPEVVTGNTSVCPGSRRIDGKHCDKRWAAQLLAYFLAEGQKSS
jgi:hypothetical protein